MSQSTQDATDRPLKERVADLIAAYNAKPKDDWWLLEPGEPLLQNLSPFETELGDGPETAVMFEAYTPDGELLRGVNLNDLWPKKWKRFDREHFKKTPNEFAIGNDGTLLVSAGRWGRRPKGDGLFEWLPIQQYHEWREEQMLLEPRAAEHKPAWAEKARAIADWGVIDYSSRRGAFEIKQRLEKDGSMMPAHGWASASFDTSEDLRQIAADALAMASVLDGEAA